MVLEAPFISFLGIYSNNNDIGFRKHQRIDMLDKTDKTIKNETRGVF